MAKKFTMRQKIKNLKVALRENMNFTAMIRQCEMSQADFSCYDLYKTKCEQFTGGL